MPPFGSGFKLVNLPVFGSLPTVAPGGDFNAFAPSAVVPAAANAPAAILPAIAPASTGPANKSPIAAAVPAMTTGSENIALKPSFIPSANATPIGLKTELTSPFFSLPSQTVLLQVLLPILFFNCLERILQVPE